MAKTSWAPRAVINAALAVTTTLGAGCNKEVGGQLGQLAGNVGGSYLSRTGIPGTESITDVTSSFGGLIGEEIAKYLDERERMQAESAARESINSNAVGPASTRTWKSETSSRVSGGSTVIARNTGPDGRECRTQRNFVNIKGKDVEQTEMLCRDPKTGVWAPGTA